MKIFYAAFILLCCFISHCAAQNDYLVTTSSAQEASLTEEEQFIRSNFPLQILCKWTPGIKFMFIPSNRDIFLPLLSSYEDEKEVNSSTLKHKILTFIKAEEKSRELSSGTNYSTRFIFECEGKKYYHEIKNMRLDELCTKNPRACINGLVYLKDVDTAKELLIGRKIYILAESARKDDPNNYAGYQEVPIPANTEATITAVGVGSQPYPVKIIFTDSKGDSFYLEVALSRTNSGMDMNNFQAEKKMKYFSNAISFSNKQLGKVESLKNKYLGLIVYPKKALPAKSTIKIEGRDPEVQLNLPRYTVLTIKDIQFSTPGSLATLSMEDKWGGLYIVEADLKYDIITHNDNYIEDLLGFGDIHKKYPGITEARWKLISQGELEIGMSKDECRLSIGNPIEVVLKNDSRFESWYYNGKTLEFESGTLQRFK